MLLDTGAFALTLCMTLGKYYFQGFAVPAKKFHYEMRGKECEESLSRMMACRDSEIKRDAHIHTHTE